MKKLLSKLLLIPYLPILVFIAALIATLYFSRLDFISKVTLLAAIIGLIDLVYSKSAYNNTENMIKRMSDEAKVLKHSTLVTVTKDCVIDFPNGTFTTLDEGQELVLKPEHSAFIFGDTVSKDPVPCTYTVFIDAGEPYGLKPLAKVTKQWVDSNTKPSI